MPAPNNFKGKNVFISGASRGIGLAIALALARDGANIAIAAKTVTPHPKLPGTIFTAAEEIDKAGGRGLPIKCDIRDEDSVQKAVDMTVKEFGGIDIVINNASAISLTTTEETPLKKYDLMNTINSRGTWLVSKTCLPHLLKSAEQNRNPHILTLSPPLENTVTDVTWWSNSTAYSLAKFGMSLITLGLSGELRDRGIGANCLWPLTAIGTSALQILGEDNFTTRNASIMADAAYSMLSKDGRTYTGNFEIDELYLRKNENITDFSKYVQVDPNNPKVVSDDDIEPDFFISKTVWKEVAELRSAKAKL